jgi:hypothetical protein
MGLAYILQLSIGTEPAQARPHIEEAADKAGEAIEDAAHTVATNIEPAVKQATVLAKEKVGSASPSTCQPHHARHQIRHMADTLCVMCRPGKLPEMPTASKPR